MGFHASDKDAFSNRPPPFDPNEQWVFARAHWHKSWQARCAELERLVAELDAKLDSLERTIAKLATKQ